MAKTATAAKAAPAKASGLTAYNVKTKEKGVPIIDPVINIKSGRYIASGLSEGGDKLTTILSKGNAEAAVKSKAAKKGEGWE